MLKRITIALCGIAISASADTISFAFGTQSTRLNLDLDNTTAISLNLPVFQVASTGGTFNFPGNLTLTTGNRLALVTPNSTGSFIQGYGTDTTPVIGTSFTGPNTSGSTLKFEPSQSRSTGGGGSTPQSVNCTSAWDCTVTGGLSSTSAVGTFTVTREVFFAFIDPSIVSAIGVGTPTTSFTDLTVTFFGSFNYATKVIGSFNSTTLQGAVNTGAIMALEGTATSTVPEPSSYALMGLGMFGLAAWARRRK